jgi:hypothetical protein
MCTRPPVWLYADEVLSRYAEFCQYNGIDNRRIIKLFDAFLLCGKNDRNAKCVQILEESFEELRNLIAYNAHIKSSTGKHPLILPVYLKQKYQIYYESSLAWYSCKELLKIYSVNVVHVKNMNCGFIGELIRMGLLIGKYDRTEKCYHVNLRSFVYLMKFHEYTLELYKMLPRA